MNQKPIKQITLTAARDCISQLKKIDLTKVSIDRIKTLIEPLWKGYLLSNPILRPGAILYRGIKWPIRPTNISQLSYPPSELITKDQRANRAGVSRFYASYSYYAAYSEIDAQPGEYIAISKWQTTDSIIVNSVGFTDEVFTQYQSQRKTQDINWQKHANITESPTNKLIHTFFAKEFSKNVPENSEHLYKISVAISEGFYSENSNLTGASLIENPPKILRIGGLLYPTFAMLANSDNIVLLPEVADSSLKFVSVEYIKIDNYLADNKGYEIKRLDFANSLSADGSIEWKNRPPQWNIQPGYTRTIEEDGQWTVRNDKGEIIDPE